MPVRFGTQDTFWWCQKRACKLKGIYKYCNKVAVIYLCSFWLSRDTYDTMPSYRSTANVCISFMFRVKMDSDREQKKEYTTTRLRTNTSHAHHWTTSHPNLWTQSYPGGKSHVSQSPVARHWWCATLFLRVVRGERTCRKRSSRKKKGVKSYNHC